MLLYMLNNPIYRFSITISFVSWEGGHLTLHWNAPSNPIQIWLDSSSQFHNSCHLFFFFSLYIGTYYTNITFY